MSVLFLQRKMQSLLLKLFMFLQMTLLIAAFRQSFHILIQVLFFQEIYIKKGDFQLTRGLDVLKYGSVAATPKLAKPSATLAEAAILRTVHGAAAKTSVAPPPPPAKPN